jgi:hypothetical protein
LHWPSWLLKGTISTPSDFQISAAALFLPLGFIRSSELPTHTTLMLRSLGVTLAVFCLAQVMPHELASLSGTEWLCIHALPYLAVLGAVIGWFRPAFFIIPICAASWYRFAFASKAGFAVAWGEELTLQESCLFILVGALAIAFLSRASTTIRRQSAAIFATLLLAACAIHFGNYFHSAIAKLRLDGGVFNWLMTNRTYLLLASAEGIGTNVFNGSGLEQWIFNTFRSNILLVNFVTLATQFAAILAIPFVTATRVMLMVYDAFSHIDRCIDGDILLPLDVDERGLHGCSRLPDGHNRDIAANFLRPDDPVVGQGVHDIRGGLVRDARLQSNVDHRRHG